jgi:hypothetical protein
MFDIELTFDKRPRFWSEMAFRISDLIGQEPVNMRIFPKSGGPRREPARVVIDFTEVPVVDHTELVKIAEDETFGGGTLVRVNIADYSMGDPQRERC